MLHAFSVVYVPLAAVSARSLCRGTSIYQTGAEAWPFIEFAERLGTVLCLLLLYASGMLLLLQALMFLLPPGVLAACYSAPRLGFMHTSLYWAPLAAVSVRSLCRGDTTQTEAQALLFIESADELLTMLCLLM